MNARADTSAAEDSGNKTDGQFCLNSTLGDYEVEEVSMWQLANLLAEAQLIPGDLETARPANTR
jgi:hypothetical protein